MNCGLSVLLMVSALRFRDSKIQGIRFPVGGLPSDNIFFTPLKEAKKLTLTDKTDFFANSIIASYEHWHG